MGVRCRFSITVFFVSVLLGTTLFPNAAFAYKIKTHAYLADETVRFYNEKYPDKKIPESLRDFVIDGARREDDTPRYMNHFYDPEKNRGLTYDPAIDPGVNFGSWQKSKDWAKDENNQNKPIYKIPATVASILSVIQKFKISELSSETNFTWQKAIRHYVRGEEEKAMFILGHILHLIQDTSVPDHTRNDPHPGDSPYENFSGKFELISPDAELGERLKAKEPNVVPSLKDAFTNLAKYSNNNFYSKDTIGIQSGYNKPEIHEYENKQGFRIYYQDDGEGIYVLLKKKENGSEIFTSRGEIVFDSPDILSSYWSRLSTKAVQYSTGAIKLFFDEVEKARNDPNFEAEEPKSFFATAISAIQYGIQGIGDYIRDVFTTVLVFAPDESDTYIPEELDEYTVEHESDQAAGEEQSEIIQEENSGGGVERNSNEEEEKEINPADEDAKDSDEEKKDKDEEENKREPAALNCGFETNQEPARHGVLINEVAWMGTTVSYTDEWIELKNFLHEPIDISGWKLFDTDEEIKITFPENTKIPSGGFILLERTDDDSVPDAPADIIYTGNLSNDGSKKPEVLRLFNADCLLIDEVLADPEWLAGDNASKRTMERNENGIGWHTSSVIGGTPKAQNSPPFVMFSESGGGGVAVSAKPAPEFFDVRINEIMYNPQGNDSGREWIEIKNESTSTVNLEKWRLYESGVNHTLSLSNGSLLFPPGGFAVLSSDPEKFLEDFPAFSGNLIKSSISLSNSGEAVILKNEDLSIHSVTYSPEIGANGDGNSLQIMDGVWRAGAPTPGEKNMVPNMPPIALFSFSPNDPSTGDAVTFDASSSSDSDGDIERYEWNFGNGAYSSSTEPLVQYTYATSGTYAVTLFVFDNDGERSDATSTISVSISYGPVVPASHIVISEMLFDAEVGDEGKEFIELYNPTSSTENISGWSLRKFTGGSTSSESIAVFSEVQGDTTSIDGKSFFLLGLYNYSSSSYSGKNADAARSKSLPNGSEEITISLFDSDGEEIDRVRYSSSSISAPGKSIERKTVYEEKCVIARGENEYDGNSCDRNMSEDFNERDVPNPQNSASLPEPRERLSAPSPLDGSTTTLRFDSNSITLVLEWNESTSSDPTGVIMYKIIDTSSSSSLFPVIEIASTSRLLSIQDIGREYSFEFQAFDADGWGSATSSYALYVQGFVSDFVVYADPRQGNENRYNADMYWNSFPFIPAVNGMNSRQTLVFYLNREPSASNYELSWENGFALSDGEGVMEIEYISCGGGGSNRKSHMLILSLEEKWCESGGSFSTSFKWENLEDPHLEFFVASSTNELELSLEDFLTIGYYDINAFGHFTLVARDLTKYHFSEDVPSHSAPIFDGSLEVSFNESDSRLTLFIPTSTDPDTIDRRIVYEINFSPATSTEPDDNLWNATTTQTIRTYSRTVGAGDEFLIGVRVRDDFGNFSAAQTVLWSYPEITFYIEQTLEDNWSDVFGTVLHVVSEPDSASFQSFTPEEDFSFNKVAVKIWQEQASDYGTLRLSVFSDTGASAPDFSNLISSATISNLLDPDKNIEQTFTFSSSISVLAGTTYWLVLDVAGYSNDSGYFRNKWRNAVAVGGGAYERGIAGKGKAMGKNASCDGILCSFTPNYSSVGPADWYFRIGIKQ